MGLRNKIKSVTGMVLVQVEGFFTERFINLCKINNIKIWNIRNLTSGIVRFNMYVSDFKKIRNIAKKTKCRVNIKNKKGMYFWTFKYRKRKIFIFLGVLIIILSCVFSNFIWNIKVIGLENIKEEEIFSLLDEAGFKIGSSKIKIDKSGIASKVRSKNSNISWVGIDISGTTAYVKVIEKTKLDENSILEKSLGDIVASKSGIVTKIIAEDGTALVKTGSYVEKNMKLIEGKIYSKIVDTREVSAKGIVEANVEYESKFEYYYLQNEKNYTGKQRKNFGITINDKEYMINYLNKSSKYDKIKNSKSIKIFGCNISFDYYIFDEYYEVQKSNTKQELVEKSKVDSSNYFKNYILPNAKAANLVDRVYNIQEFSDKIVVTTKYIVNERIGEFVIKNE